LSLKEKKEQRKISFEVRNSNHETVHEDFLNVDTEGMWKEDF
jgi:hypothetical protein